MAVMDSGSHFPSRHRHVPHFMATDIIHLSWAQHCKPTFHYWAGMHLQSWCDFVPSHGPFYSPAQRPIRSTQKQGSFQLPILEHGCFNNWVCYPFGASKGVPPTSTSTYLILGSCGPLPHASVCTDADRAADMAFEITLWLVTPVIYEAYRVLQLMRGVWMAHTIRGLVCWWVLILGLQLIRVAWFAGFSAKSRQVQTSVSL